MVWHLLHSWLHRDRIRVSPSAGQLLRLKPSCCLRVAGQYAEVVGRAVDDGRPSVVYECRTRTGVGLLAVNLSNGRLAMEWCERGQVTPLAAEDVEVFPRWS
jgi:hypothetical protein